MNGRRGSRRSMEGKGALPMIISILSFVVVLFVFVFFIRFYVWDRLKKEVVGAATEAVMEKTVQRVLESQGISADDPRVQQILDSIDERDMETVTQIVTDHLDADTLSEIASELAEGDASSALEYVREEFTEEEQRKLMELAEKYPELAEQLYGGFGE